MQGFQLTFFTQHDRKHQHLSLAHWLIEEARAQGIRGATMISAAEGFGQSGVLRAANFFELVNQPIEVTMAVGESEAEQFFTRLREEKINIFYIKTPIEFGMSDDFRAVKK